MELLANCVYLAVSLCCAIPPAALGLCFGFFVCDLWLPITVDNHADWHSPPSITPSPLLTNTILLLVFPLQHTITLRGPLNTVLKSIIPDKYFRSFYALTAGLALGVTMYCWQPMPYLVWSISATTGATIVTILSVLSFLGVILSILNLDPLALDIIGLKKPLMQLLGWKAGEPSLIDTGLYGMMRHPAYTLLMMALWITPRMTVGHLLLASIYSLYMVLAVRYSEEPALLREMGSCYADYMKRTPCFVPSLTSRHEHKNNIS